VATQQKTLNQKEILRKLNVKAKKSIINCWLAKFYEIFTGTDPDMEYVCGDSRHGTQFPVSSNL
jgi:hypothetical protein